MDVALEEIVLSDLSINPNLNIVLEPKSKYSIGSPQEIEIKKLGVKNEALIKENTDLRTKLDEMTGKYIALLEKQSNFA